MKKGKRLFAIFAFVMLGLFAFAFTSVTTVYAESETLDFSTGAFASNTITWTGSGLTIVQEKGTSSTNPNSNYVSAPRWYGGNTLTFTPAENYSITSLIITCTSDSYANVFENSTWSVGSSVTNGSVVTWSGSANDSFTLVPSAQTRISTLSYTYTETIAPTSVSITETLELNVGTTASLSATVLPENASNKVVVWSSDDESIATVDENGVVTGIAAGTTTITATINGTELTDTCTVTVLGGSQEIIDFVATDLQEQLAFHYDYQEFEKVTAPVDDVDYYLGMADDFGIHLGTGATSSSNTITGSSNITLAANYSVIAQGDYFLIKTGTKYLQIEEKTDNKGKISYTLKTVEIETATINDTYLFSIDATSGVIKNKAATRFLGFATTNGLYNQIRQYAVTNIGTYPAAVLLTTNGSMALTDKAANNDAVTMRIGLTMTKSAYNKIKELDSNATFGVYLNNKEYVACTPVEVNDTTYRFYVAINGITAANFDTVLTAAGYASVNGETYYTTDVNTYSVKTLALEYVTNHLDDANVLAAKYALTYLAYNA